MLIRDFVSTRSQQPYLRSGALRGLLALALRLGACSTLSVDDEKKLGAQAQRSQRQQAQILRDRVVVDYVRKVADDLTKAADPTPFELRVYVVEDEAINATAYPAGAIYVNTGTITVSNDVSELAGVIAHEIAHVTARHVAQNYNRQRNTGIIVQILQQLGGLFIPGGQLGAQVGAVIFDTAGRGYINSFTREAEAEADRLAIGTMVRAGYDPEGLIRLFRTLQAESGGGSGLRFLQNHPTNEERVASAERLIAEMGSPTGKSDDRGRLDIIKERIDLITGTDSDLIESDDEEEESDGGANE